MHMADALASPAVAVVVGTATISVAAYSIHKIKKDNEDIKKIPLMGVMAAFVFAAQMLNFSIPGTGSSGHISGAFLLAVLLGPYSAFLSMVVILLLQCLLFADGGLMVLGCNIWNMAFYACFVGYFLIYKPIIRSKHTKKRIMVASIIGCVVSTQMGAFSVVLETMISGITTLPFTTFLLLMQPIHLAIGLVEGVLTGLVLAFVYETRPEMMDAEYSKNKFSYKKILLLLGMVTIIFAAGISLLASGNPDGLEWSIEKTKGGQEVISEGVIYDAATNIVEFTAVLPDYALKSSDSQMGTTVAGVVGAIVVAGVCVGICAIINLTRKRKAQKYAENR